jgi:hypothetical protein
MAVIKQLDQNYTTPVLLGLQKPGQPGKNGIKKNELIIKAEKGPGCSLKNQINYHESLHTKQIQYSNYVKIDDNLLNFDLNRKFGLSGSAAKPLSDDLILTLKNELHRVHLKFLSEKMVRHRRNFLIQKKMIFMDQVLNLRNKGYRIDTQRRLDCLIEANYPKIRSTQDYKDKKAALKYFGERLGYKMTKFQNANYLEIHSMLRAEKNYEKK